MSMNNNNNKIVSREAWTEARRAFLEEEKALTKARDALAAKRRALPMVKIDKPYVFDDIIDQNKKKVSLLDLFDGRRQLAVYHFMLAPGWEAGCKSCSYVTDHLVGSIPHLRQRDTSLVAISRAPIKEIEAFKKRMGWTNLRWVSSFESDFNYDFQVSFPDHADDDLVTYNFRQQTFGTTDAPGLSTFLRDGEGTVFHTYSTYARGLDPLIGAYNVLDLTPLGRHEEGLKFAMEWVRHHDRYEPQAPSSK